MSTPGSRAPARASGLRRSGCPRTTCTEQWWCYLPRSGRSAPRRSRKPGSWSTACDRDRVLRAPAQHNAPISCAGWLPCFKRQQLPLQGAAGTAAQKGRTVGEFRGRLAEQHREDDDRQHHRKAHPWADQALSASDDWHVGWQEDTEAASPGAPYQRRCNSRCLSPSRTRPLAARTASKIRACCRRSPSVAFSVRISPASCTGTDAVDHPCCLQNPRTYGSMHLSPEPRRGSPGVYEYTCSAFLDL